MQNSMKRRLRGLITRECVAKGIHMSNINFAIQHAHNLLDKGETIASCSRTGISVAEAQQRRSDYKKRGATSYVA